MKKYLFSFLLVCISLFGQPRDKFPAFIPIVPFETQVISFQKIDGDFSVYYTYKIPYSLLVFERQGELFSASFRITIEISDNDGKLVARDIKDNKLSVPNFESTNAPGLFLQDFLSFSVKKNDYKVLAIISDLNSSGDLPLKPINLNLAEDENKIVLHPIVVKPEEINCDEQNSFIVSNSGGRIPFSLEEFNLIIPGN